MAAKILCWDVESTHLRGDFATLLCIGYKWLGEKKTHVLNVMDYPGWDKDKTNDKGLVKAFLEVYNSADVTVTYYGKGFDLKMINAKALEHGLPYPAPIPMVDLYYVVRGNLSLSRKSLENVGIFAGLTTKKTPVTAVAWKKAATGHKPSINYVVAHCKADVLLLEEAYLKLRPLMKTHPRVGGWAPCRYCSGRLQRRGKAISPTKGRRYKFQCQDCGGWETRPLMPEEDDSDR